MLLPAGLLALVGEQGTQARPLPGLGRPLHLVYRPNSLKRDRIARLVQALQSPFPATDGTGLKRKRARSAIGPSSWGYRLSPARQRARGTGSHTSLADITRGRRSPAAA